MIKRRLLLVPNPRNRKYHFSVEVDGENKICFLHLLNMNDKPIASLQVTIENFSDLKILLEHLRWVVSRTLELISEQQLSIAASLAGIDVISEKIPEVDESINHVVTTEKHV